MSYSELIKCYNNRIQDLITMAESELINTNEQTLTLIETLKRRIRIAIMNDPEVLIQETGGVLFDYRIKIEKLNSNSDIKEELKGINLKEFNNVIEILLNKWTNYTIEEKNEIINSIKILLKTYCKYKKMKMN